MKSANPDIQLAMFLSIKKAVKEHREKTGADKPLHLILSSKDFKRMRGMPGMKRKVHHYATIPEGTFYLSDTKPNPKDYVTIGINDDPTKIWGEGSGIEDGKLKDNVKEER